MRSAVILALATEERQIGTVHLYSSQLRQFQSAALSAAQARCRRAAERIGVLPAAPALAASKARPQRWRSALRRLIGRQQPHDLHDQQRLHDEPPGRFSL
jgi:hypothetical protein